MRSLGRLSFLVVAVPLVFGSLVGCSGNSEAKIPTKPYEGAMFLDWTIFESVEIEVDGNWLCPVSPDGELIVLTPGATGDLSNKTITLAGSTFKSGDRVAFGSSMPMEGGFDCGGKHFDKAIHIVSDAAPSVNNGA